jgi:hypothetical protein
MAQSRCEVIAVEEIERSFGVHALIVRTDERVLLADFGMSRTIARGATFLARILRWGEFASTSGAVLPLVPKPGMESTAWLETLRRQCTPKGNGRFDPAPLMAAAIADDCGSSVGFVEPAVA